VLPVLDREWAATTAAARELEAELPYPLSDLLTAITAALTRRSMHERITSHLPKR
jgi:hypothetical protein